MHPGSLVVLLALIMACSAARPAAAQGEAEACANEVQRLADAFAIEGGGGGGELGAAIADQPGARKGASLGRQERQRVGDLVARARQAGEQGDGQACLQHLAETRALLREAGLGGGQPGTAGGPGATTSGSISEGSGETETNRLQPSAPSGTTTGGGGIGGGGGGGSGGGS